MLASHRVLFWGCGGEYGDSGGLRSEVGRNSQKFDDWFNGSNLQINSARTQLLNLF